LDFRIFRFAPKQVLAAAMGCACANAVLSFYLLEQPEGRRPMFVPNPKPRRASASGNALMEYAVPAGVLLVSVGIIATCTDVNKLMAEYFMAASGHTQSALSGTTYKTDALAGPGYGSVGNGSQGFSSFGSMSGGGGGGGGGGGTMYYGAISRAGGRTPSPSAEYLYP
jgi:hypothetical protein